MENPFKSQQFANLPAPMKALLRRFESATKELSDEACRAQIVVMQAYAVLAPIHTQWNERHTEAGQRLLCEMREIIAESLGLDAQLIQDAFQSGDRNAIAALRAKAKA